MLFAKLQGIPPASAFHNNIFPNYSGIRMNARAIVAHLVSIAIIGIAALKTKLIISAGKNKGRCKTKNSNQKNDFSGHNSSSRAPVASQLTGDRRSFLGSKLHHLLKIVKWALASHKKIDKRRGIPRWECLVWGDRLAALASNLADRW